MIKNDYKKIEDYLINDINEFSEDCIVFMRYFLRLRLNPVISKDIGIDDLKRLLLELVEDKVNGILDQKKNIEIMRYLNKNLTKKQIDNYKVKIKLARACLESNDFSPFETESMLSNIDPETVVKNIITIGEKWERFYETLTVKADSVRQMLLDNLDRLPEDEIVFEKINKLETTESLESFISSLIPIDTQPSSEEDRVYLKPDRNEANLKLTGVDFNPEDE